jgi:hypothetical protein
VGHQFGVIAGGSGADYRIRWLDGTLMSGFAASGVRDGDTHLQIVAHGCAALVDCRVDPSLPDCDPAKSDRAGRERRLELGCARTGQRILCDVSGR